MTVIWFVVLEIPTATDRFLFSPWAIFCPLPPSPLENKNIKKMKKNAWRYHQYIIKISQAYQKSYHRLYCSWDMECDGCNSYLWFWAIFCTFTPITAQKIKISKINKTTPGDIIILHKCTKNHDYMLYCSLDMACDRCKCYFSFSAIFKPFIPLAAWKMKI